MLLSYIYHLSFFFSLFYISGSLESASFHSAIAALCVQDNFLVRRTPSWLIVIYLLFIDTEANTGQMPPCSPMLQGFLYVRLSKGIPGDSHVAVRIFFRTTAVTRRQIRRPYLVAAEYIPYPPCPPRIIAQSVVCSFFSSRKQFFIHSTFLRDATGPVKSTRS